MTQIEIRKYASKRCIRGYCASSDVLYLPRCIATDGGWIRPLLETPIWGLDLLLFWKVDTSLTERNKLWIPRYSSPFISQEEQYGTWEIFTKMVSLLETCCDTIVIETRVEFDILRFTKSGILVFYCGPAGTIKREKWQSIVDEVLSLAEQYFYFIHAMRTVSNRSTLQGL